MKGIHVIAVAFLASCAVVAANEDPEETKAQSLSADRHYGNIPTVCPFPERHWWNTTTNLPHETDCTKFYKCFLGKPIVQDCPLMYKHYPVTRLHYNRFEMVCDWQWRAGCISCPEPDEDGRYPPSSSRISNRRDDCNSYWECPVRGQPRLEYCPSGKCFSRTCQKCVKNRRGGYCDGRPDPGPGPGPDKCKNGERKRHHCNCNKFYECIDEDWYDASCKGGLHFDPRTQRCTTPDKADCIWNPFQAAENE